MTLAAALGVSALALVSTAPAQDAACPGPEEPPVHQYGFGDAAALVILAFATAWDPLAPDPPEQECGDGAAVPPWRERVLAAERFAGPAPQREHPAPVLAVEPAWDGRSVPARLEGALEAQWKSRAVVPA